MPRQALFMCAGHGAPTSVRTSDNCEAKADREVTRGVEVPPETLWWWELPAEQQPHGMDAAGRQL